MLNGHFDECVHEIESLLEYNQMTSDEIREACIKKALLEGFTPDQVIGMVTISLEMQDACIATEQAPNHLDDGKNISICTLSKFARQFLGNEFEVFQLEDTIARILRVARRNRNNRFRFEYGTHVSAIMKRAIKIARKKDFDDIDDLVNYLENRNDSVVESILRDVYTELECC